MALPPPADQWAAYSQLKEKHSEMVVAEHYCLIYASWLKAWQSHTKDGNAKSPGEIDNTRLLESETTPKSNIKEGLQEGQDYELVHESIWQLLHGWYGGGPVLTRNVITEGENFKRVEVYPLTLKLLHTNKDGIPAPASEYTLSISKTAGLDAVKKAGCQQFKLDESKVRLWNMFSNNAELMSDGGKTLDDLRLVPGQRVLFEVQLSDGTWPRANKTDDKKKAGLLSRMFGSGGSGGTGHDHHRDSPANYPRGLCGLQNLGNTCFMNAALQCLSNTGPLNEFFLSGSYKAKVNKSNPLGMKGELAEHFADLMRDLWCGKYQSVAPKDLKWKIGKLNPSFSGYNQHDSQELLAFLLDGLHEDLNQITKKPYVEITDSNGRQDAVVADEHWNAHKRRNESFIVDTFQGQLKSTITCPKCPKISITFDPFMYLSLPLPVNTTRYVEVVLMRADRADLGRRYSCKLEKSGSVSELLTSLSALTNIPADRLEVCDVFNQRIYETLAPSRPLSAIKQNDVIFAYEIPHGVDIKSKDTIRVEVLHRYGNQLFSYPFTLFFTSASTGKDIWHTVWRAAKRYVTPLDVKTKGELTVEALDIDRVPFKLVIGSQTGMHCGVCSSMTSNCRGCPIPYKDKPPEFKRNDITLVLHFPGENKRDYYMPDKAESVYKDGSVDKNRTADKSGPQLTLIDCLKCFTVNEKLGPKDEWYCPSCKEHVQAFKRLELWKVPNVLVIHLKRFQVGMWGMREKLNSLIDFPLTEFDLSPYVLDSRQKQESLQYDLFAVSNHMGGLGGGHYTAYAKNKEDGAWHYFNDSSCSSVKNSADVKSEAAYVLFYQRRQSAAPQGHP